MKKSKKVLMIIFLIHIVNDVIEEQSLDIDAVSGATVSSKCILKAVENAIEKGDLSR